MRTLAKEITVRRILRGFKRAGYYRRMGLLETKEILGY